VLGSKSPVTWVALLSPVYGTAFLQVFPDAPSLMFSAFMVFLGAVSSVSTKAVSHVQSNRLRWLLRIAGAFFFLAWLWGAALWTWWFPEEKSVEIAGLLLEWFFGYLSGVAVAFLAWADHA